MRKFFQWEILLSWFIFFSLSNSTDSFRVSTLLPVLSKQNEQKELWALQHSHFREENIDFFAN